jgi:chemosensory pili system protein ChpB (putative protein-glutamate methylesterase)
MGESRRVALLARPGEACERLRAALREAGGEIVIEADPATLDPQSLRVAAVETVLVALDPAVEDALEKFDEVLGDRAIEVIFDEADLAARREGWDAARWVRHLAAKLHRHDDVLPPGREPEDDEEIDVDAIHVASEADVAYAEEDNAFEMIEEIEMPPVAAAEAIDMPSLESIEMPSLDAIDMPALESIAMPAVEAFEMPSVAAIEVEEAPLEAVSLEAVSFDADAASFDLPSFDMPSFEAAPVQATAPAPAAEYGALSFTDDVNALDFDAGDAPAFTAPTPQFGQDAQDFDALLRDLGASEVEEVATVDVAPMEMPAVREFAPKEVLPSLDFDIAMPAAPTPKEAERAMPSFGSLSLEALSDEPAVATATATLRADEAPVAANFRHDLAKLEEKISSLSLMSETGHEARGAVVILAGIGGPDAVRQILTALPENFARAVLIQQRLDGGRYDRLVQQLARAASMQVLLAEAAQVIQPGKVYIVPPEIGVAANAGAGLRFADGGTLIDALPSDDSAVLLLSGADAAMVESAMAHAERGALVAGQSPEGCYDAAAPIALAERGGHAGTPNELVQSLLKRWPA